MIRVHTPVKGHSGVVAGVRFVDGVGQTEDPSAISYFQRHGYKMGPTPDEAPPADSEPVDGTEAPAGADKGDEAPPAGQETPPGLPEDASIPEMRAYAKQRGIDLGDARTKKDIRDVLTGPPD